MTDIVVVGAGGFGRETLDVIEAINRAGGEQFHVVGVADDSPNELSLQQLAARGYRHLGGVFEALEGRPRHYTLGIGSPGVRDVLATRFEQDGWTAATLVHPRAVLGSEVTVGPGAVICAGVQVSTNVHLGALAHLNPGSVIGHDSRIGRCVSVNPGAVVSGEVILEDRVLIGAGAVVLQGLRVGRASTVGAAACVTKDVAPETVVVGVPAREITV